MNNENNMRNTIYTTPRCTDATLLRLLDIRQCRHRNLNCRFQVPSVSRFLCSNNFSTHSQSSHGIYFPSTLFPSPVSFSVSFTLIIHTTHYAPRTTHYALRTTHYRNHHHHHHHDTTARVVCFHNLHLDGKNAGTMGCTTPIVLIPLLMLIMSMTILPARCLSCNSGNTFYEKYTCHANEMASKFSVSGLVCLDTQIMNHIGTYSLNTSNSIAAEMNRKLANTGCPKVVIPCYDGRRSSSTNGLGYFIQLESDCSSGLSRCYNPYSPLPDSTGGGGTDDDNGNRNDGYSYGYSYSYGSDDASSTSYCTAEDGKCSISSSCTCQNSGHAKVQLKTDTGATCYWCGKIGDGGSCSSPTSCSSGMCKNDRCAGAKCKSAACTSCNNDGDCAACISTYVLSSLDQCVPKTSDGGSCSSSSSCSSGMCKNDRCAGAKCK